MFYKIDGISKRTGMGTVYVVIRGEVAGKKKETIRTTKVSVKPTHFNSKTGKVNGKDPLYVEKNAQLQTIWADMEIVARNLEWAGLAPDKQAVARELQEIADALEGFAIAKAGRIADKQSHYEKLLREVEEMELQLRAKRAEVESLEMYLGIRSKPLLLSTLFEDFKVVKAKENVKVSTLKNYTVLKNIVAGFRKQALLTDVNLDFFIDFQAHLVKRGVTNKSILEVLGKFKSVFRYYANRHNISTSFLSEFKPVKDGQPNDVLFLTSVELAELEALTINTPGQRDVRQQFLFAVETGLRRSDYNVTKTDVKGSELTVVTRKTGKIATIPFTKKAARLFKESGYNFRLIREAQFNQTLRAICKKLPSMQAPVDVFTYVGSETIKNTYPKWELMSSHVARKTYAHNALSKGASISAVAEWLGHQSTKMLDLHYSNKKELARQEAHKMLD